MPINIQKLSPEYITGLVDAEGCFYVQVTKSTRFFKKYKLQKKSKKNSFDIFCKIADLVKKDLHQTKGGIEKIKLLKLKMNI